MDKAYHNKKCYENVFDYLNQEKEKYINSDEKKLQIIDEIYNILQKVIEDDKCIGCKEDQPNQQAHMEYGGCLYLEE
jgi:hypothetical protein